MTNNKIINWDNVFSESENFQSKKPFKYAYIKGVFNNEFYEKLYKTYPKRDETWTTDKDYRRSGFSKTLRNDYDTEITYDDSLSPEWNEFKKYISSNDFIENFKKFSGIGIKGVFSSSFIAYEKGCFLLPHIDADGDYSQKIAILFYLSKNWKEGEAGGTHFSKDDDESTIFFEPYDLDNSMVCFEETPQSWHGCRMITKDVRRQAISVNVI